MVAFGGGATVEKTGSTAVGGAMIGGAVGGVAALITGSGAGGGVTVGVAAVLEGAPASLAGAPPWGELEAWAWPDPWPDA